MTVIVASAFRDRSLPEARSPERRAVGPRVEIFAHPQDCEPIWRRFQDTGLATPFQRFDWVTAFLRSHPGQADDMRVALAFDAGGRPQMLLPVTIERRLGLRIGAPLGGRQASYKMPILSRDPVPGPGLLRALLIEAGAKMGLDAYQFLGAPVAWSDLDNPLSDGARRSPSDAFSLALDATGEETLARVLGKPARKKLRQKEKWLARLGEVDHVEPAADEAIDAVLDTFFDQKAERLRRLGIPDPFASGEARAFLREGCRRPSPDLPPAIELHALTVDGRPVAIFAGAGDAARMSGMVISFDPEPEIARCSPGELLIARVIEAQCRRGRRVFDLGVGEARYKRSFCDTVDPLVDILLPVTENGRLYAAATRLAMDAKRFVKQTSWTMRLVRTMRRSTALVT